MARSISELIKSFAPERQAAIEADANEITTEMIATADSLKNRKGYGGKRKVRPPGKQTRNKIAT